MGSSVAADAFKDSRPLLDGCLGTRGAGFGLRPRFFRIGSPPCSAGKDSSGAALNDNVICLWAGMAAVVQQRYVKGVRYKV